MADRIAYNSSNLFTGSGDFVGAATAVSGLDSFSARAQAGNAFGSGKGNAAYGDAVNQLTTTLNHLYETLNGFANAARYSAEAIIQSDGTAAGYTTQLTNILVSTDPVQALITGLTGPGGR